jgi:hypothetical protein
LPADALEIEVDHTERKERWRERETGKLTLPAVRLRALGLAAAEINLPLVGGDLGPRHVPLYTGRPRMFSRKSTARSIS